MISSAKGSGLGGLAGFGGLGSDAPVTVGSSGSLAAALKNFNSPEAFYSSLVSPRKGARSGASKESLVSKKQRGGRTLKSTKAHQSQIKELRGKIVLDVVRAKNLAKADIIGKSDPYAICQTTTGAPRYKTKIIKNTLDPEWNERTSFQVFIDGELIITVWDWDRIGKDDFLGVLTVPFEDIVSGKWSEGKWTLFTRETSEKSKKKAPGEIFLKIFWEPDQKETNLPKSPKSEASPVVLSIPKLANIPPKVSRHNLLELVSPPASPEGSPRSDEQNDKSKDISLSPKDPLKGSVKGAVKQRGSGDKEKEAEKDAKHDRQSSSKSAPSPKHDRLSSDKDSTSTHQTRKSSSTRKSSTHIENEDAKDEKSPTLKTKSAPSIPPLTVTPKGSEPKEEEKKMIVVSKPPTAQSKPGGLGLGGLKLNLATVPEKGIASVQPVEIKPLVIGEPKRADSGYKPGQVTARLSEDGAIGAKYEFKETLGEGAFAVVKRAINRTTNEAVAVKIANKTGHWTENTAKRFKQEIEIIYGLDHPYVVSVRDIDETLQNVYIVMELVTGGDLFHAIVKATILPEPIASKSMKEILHGLQYIHENSIVHRDMKCENVLISATGHCKLADFGVSCYIKEGELLNEWAGTMLYMAPEQMNGRGYGLAIDLWAVGIIAYNALSGTHPFDGGNNATLLQSVSESKIDFPVEDWADNSKEAKDFVSRLIEPDVSKRYTIEKALDHPWIKRHSRRAAKEEKEKKKQEATQEKESHGDASADLPMISPRSRNKSKQ